jgi:hypothetical protein
MQFKTLSDYIYECNRAGQPTGYYDTDSEQWLMIEIARTRDSDILDVSNFRSIYNDLKKIADSNNIECGVEILRFGHWACGWVEYLVISKDDIMIKEAEKAVQYLRENGLYDEDDYYKELYKQEQLDNDYDNDDDDSDDIISQYDIAGING